MKDLLENVYCETSQVKFYYVCLITVAGLSLEIKGWVPGSNPNNFWRGWKFHSRSKELGIPSMVM